MDKYIGKYRGTVVDSFDLQQRGRVMVQVPQFDVIEWAMPCVPYSDLTNPLTAIPAIGTNVWVEFEGGNLNYPIWVGCYWW